MKTKNPNKKLFYLWLDKEVRVLLEEIAIKRYGKNKTEAIKELIEKEHQRLSVIPKDSL